MNHEMKRKYEDFVLRVADWTKGHSTPLSIVGSVVGCIVLGTWGYKAGSIGGAILFTIFGALFGGMIGSEISNSIITALGTVRRTIVLLALVGASILLSYLLKSLSLGFLLFIAICIYLYYLRRQPLP